MIKEKIKEIKHYIKKHKSFIKKGFNDYSFYETCSCNLNIRSNIKFILKLLNDK